MTPISVRDVLRRSALLEDARDDTLELLQRSSRARRLDRGAMLIHEGDQPTSVFFIADGLLRSFTTSFDGAEPTLTVMLPGDHVGELGVIDGTARSASVASLRPSTVVEVSGTTFRAALEADVAIYRDAGDAAVTASAQHVEPFVGPHDSRSRCPTGEVPPVGDGRCTCRRAALLPVGARPVARWSAPEHQSVVGDDGA